MSSPWGELYNIFPSLLDWVPGPHQRIFQNFKRLRDLIAHSVHDHQASLDPRSPRDFIDCFLTKTAEEDPLSHFHMDTLLMTTHNLLFGGTETVGTTLRHAFLALMKYPKVQARVQEEIDLAVGGARLPAALEDRSTMPYTDPVIHQVRRFADIIPMNLPHRLTRDTAFSGLLIPKGTDIITLLNTIHYGPSQFLTPQEFNPKHFWMPISPSRRAQPLCPSQLEPRLTPCDYWIMLYPMLSVLVFGNRYGYGDPEFLRLLNLFSDNFRIMSSRWGEVPGTQQRVSSAHSNSRTQRATSRRRRQ
ncbi:cytochrome P450 2F5-like [Macaca thibetana thibetana]|uniref:cytochrome P450 2F5-like n=1 Tax=Macaca thibetana thibetana TaxID=257877 RepID=UPI0021BC9011|nr:cytochrome P450 2F5-like [Macaca thibetana thibetana]